MDDQRVDQKGSSSDSQGDFAMQGFVNTIVAVTIGTIVLLTALGLWDHWHPSTAPKAEPPMSLSEAIIGGIFGGALVGFIAGSFCGLGVMVVRMAKK